AVFATVRIFLNSTAIPYWFLLQCRPITTTGGFMNVQATYYRRRAIVARQSAAAAMDPSVKAAFAEVACHWLGLAEHTEWLQSMQRGSIRSGGGGGGGGGAGRAPQPLSGGKRILGRTTAGGSGASLLATRGGLLSWIPRIAGSSHASNA